MQYDVFVSYRQKDPDKTWVRSALAPRLEAAGLRVFIDYKCFRLGAALVEEMERGVLESSYTLAVLTPRYLQSGFTEFESILARHMSLETQQRRLIVVMREPCDAPLRTRAYLWLDMTDDTEFETQLTRLIEELRQPA
ncbi:MAG: toll/interleukin-1 receptor domain-containing protein [Acidobacteriota bacterium]